MLISSSIQWGITGPHSFISPQIVLSDEMPYSGYNILTGVLVDLWIDFVDGDRLDCGQMCPITAFNSLEDIFKSMPWFNDWQFWHILFYKIMAITLNQNEAIHLVFSNNWYIYIYMFVCVSVCVHLWHGLTHVRAKHGFLVTFLALQNYFNKIDLYHNAKNKNNWLLATLGCSIGIHASCINVQY